MKAKKTLLDFGLNWTLHDLILIGKRDLGVEVSAESLLKVKKAHNTLELLSKEGKWIYGLSSGFGPLAGENASNNPLHQKRLIYHLASGVGPHLSAEQTRMIFALRLKQMAAGHSGIHPETFSALFKAYNSSFDALVPALGSVGASGDLTPLAHLALALSGEGSFRVKGQEKTAADFKKYNFFPAINWQDKDALAFVNGTSAMVALACQNCYSLELLFSLSSQLAFTYSECMGAYREAWHPKLAKLHPQKGHKAMAEWLFSESETGWFTDFCNEQGEPVFSEKWPQDPYSIRCIPQLLGAVKDQLKQVHDCLEIELNSISDNPNFFADSKEVIHGGNFNGQHLSFASDQLNIQIAYLGIYAEKRISTLCDPKLNQGLSAFLKAGMAGENSGYMGAQVTASALSAELKSLYRPLSLETLSTNGQNQDMVSMGTASAWRGNQMIGYLKNILSIEAMVISTAVEQRQQQVNKSLSTQSTTWLEHFKPNFQPLTEDRPLSFDIKAVSEKMISIIEKFDRAPFKK